MGQQQAAVTVAIVGYKTPELAGHCLASMLRQPNHARWVHDVELVQAEKLPVAGYSAALDSVFRHAKTDLLLALNADVVFPDEPIDPLLELFTKHSQLGLLGVRQRDSQGWLRHCGIPDPGSPEGGPCYGEADVGQYTESFASICQVSGSVMFIRRKALESVGGFERMPRLYYEDAILCLRLRRFGWKVGYSGLVTFTHDVASSPSSERPLLAGEGRRAWERELMAGPGI